MRVVLLAILAALARDPRAARADEVRPIARPSPWVTPPQVPALSPSPDLTSFTGLPVTRATVVIEGDVWSVRPTPPGFGPLERFTASAARAALLEMLATGRFARGRMTCARDGAGVALVFSLAARRLVAGLHVELHGAPVDRDELLRQANLSEGGEVVGVDLPEAEERAARFLAIHGFPSARVRIATAEGAGAATARVLVSVDPGPARVLSDRAFYVAGPNADGILAIASRYAASAGDRADERSLDDADAALSQLLRSRGYHRAQVTHDLVWMGVPPAPGRVVLRVQIAPGPRVVSRFEGNESYDADVLESVLGVGSESDRSPSHLADKVRAFYQKRGFLDVEVQAQVRDAPSGAVELLVFHVIEHHRVTVAGRVYPCFREALVRHLHAGGPRSPAEIGTEIDSFLDEELPGADLFVDPNPAGAPLGGTGQLASALPTPIDLNPNATYVAAPYERAVEHVQELYRSEGFLHAEVGPVAILRAQCSPNSPANRCDPLPLPIPNDVCAYDRSGLPVASDGLGLTSQSLTCRPDRARGVTCSDVVELFIPVRLGPRTRLWDVAFTGVKQVSERAMAEAAAVPLGEPASTTKLEEARRRILDAYRELGYYYVDVKYALEPSADGTRARVRFDVTEGDPVLVRAIVLHGLENTKEGLVRRRLALEVGRPFRPSGARRTEEQLATLGVFSSVTVSLSDAYVAQPIKDVIIEVVERDSQYVEVRPGFSTGEGVRGVLEYGHRNLLGEAWNLTIHLQASYLPEFLILDPQVDANYYHHVPPLSTADRIATRNTITVSFPEIGLGPLVRGQIDGIYVRDLERDFTLFKASALATLLWRPLRELQVSGGPGYERNDIFLFGGQSVLQYLQSLAAVQDTTDLQRLLRVPDGDSNVVATRLVASWDRRDNAFNAHRGTYVSAGLEQINSYPVKGTADASEQFQSHFLRLTQTLAGYLPLTSSVTLAAEVRLGEIANVTPCARPFAVPAGTSPPPAYCTYPDRLFFMGGFESMRGWLQDAFIPQEYADQIAADGHKPDSDPSKFTLAKVPLRGGNLMFNPRFEVRFPVRAPLDAALFADFGNLWNDPATVLHHALSLRADVGAGVRLQTPVGPLVFDYGVNVTRRPYEDFGAFHFAIGLF